MADHPRIRGEHSFEGEGATSGQGSSPHTRGALGAVPDDGYDVRIIPAYAGSTRRSSDRSARRPDHPRIRGEHTSSSASWRLESGSSPHTRGAPHERRPFAFDNGIIPAYAGSTYRLWIPVVGVRDHPRIRGEHANLRR